MFAKVIIKPKLLRRPTRPQSKNGLGLTRSMDNHDSSKSPFSHFAGYISAAPVILLRIFAHLI